MFTWARLNEKDQFQNYRKVHEWLPSNRPIFKWLLTGELVRLDKVLTSEVIITKSCGKNRRVRKGAFLREFRLQAPSQKLPAPR